jgi:hypothetical protein
LLPRSEGITTGVEKVSNKRPRQEGDMTVRLTITTSFSSEIYYFEVDGAVETVENIKALLEVQVR